MAAVAEIYKQPDSFAKMLLSFIKAYLHVLSIGPAVSYYKSSTPTFHSGHISNIRCLTSVNSYLISGGGRGMLAVWRLDSERTNQPGLVGWISLDTGVRESGPLHSCLVCKINRNGKSMCDLRVMTLLGYQTHQECIFVIAGCSDGSISPLLHVPVFRYTNPRTRPLIS
ncbi:hypothetical protein ACTXT7_008919 [Hymenolepis weldensis]